MGIDDEFTVSAFRALGLGVSIIVIELEFPMLTATGHSGPILAWSQGSLMASKSQPQDQARSTSNWTSRKSTLTASTSSMAVL